MIKAIEAIEKMPEKNENSPFHHINFRPLIIILPLILLMLCGLVSPVNAAETMRMRATKSGLKVATRNLKPVNLKFLIKSAQELKKLDIDPMDWVAFTSMFKAVVSNPVLSQPRLKALAKVNLDKHAVNICKGVILESGFNKSLNLKLIQTATKPFLFHTGIYGAIVTVLTGPLFLIGSQIRQIRGGGDDSTIWLFKVVSSWLKTKWDDSQREQREQRDSKPGLLDLAAILSTPFGTVGLAIISIIFIIKISRGEKLPPPLEAGKELLFPAKKTLLGYIKDGLETAIMFTARNPQYLLYLYILFQFRNPLQNLFGSSEYRVRLIEESSKITVKAMSIVTQMQERFFKSSQVSLAKAGQDLKDALFTVDNLRTSYNRGLLVLKKNRKLIENQNLVF